MVCAGDDTAGRLSVT